MTCTAENGMLAKYLTNTSTNRPFRDDDETLRSALAQTEQETKRTVGDEKCHDRKRRNKQTNKLEAIEALTAIATLGREAVV